MITKRPCRCMLCMSSARSAHSIWLRPWLRAVSHVTAWQKRRQGNKLWPRIPLPVLFRHLPLFPGTLAKFRRTLAKFFSGGGTFSFSLSLLRFCCGRWISLIARNPPRRTPKKPRRCRVKKNQLSQLSQKQRMHWIRLRRKEEPETYIQKAEMVNTQSVFFRAMVN